MDKFRVGQMVRKVRPAQPESGDWPIGTIGTITGPRTLQLSACGKYVWAYTTDQFSEHGQWIPSEEILAPVYDGDLPASWEGCAWKPEKVKA